jgi:dihydroflavonol-4-reductase
LPKLSLEGYHESRVYSLDIAEDNTFCLNVRIFRLREFRWIATQPISPFQLVMRIFVTGATGFLGNNLVRKLVAQGHQVTAAVRLVSDLRPLDGLAVEIVTVNWNDPSDIARAIEGVDVVVHAAAIIHLGWRHLDESRIANVESTRRLATAARRRGIRMIYVSTVDTLAAATAETVVDELQIDPIKLSCSYVVSKREAEQALLEQVEQGLDGLIVNPGFMVGPWDWKPSSGKMMLMLAKQPILFFVPRGGCSVVDVRDVAHGILGAIEHGRTGQRYILAGHNLLYLDLWTKMAQVIGKRPPVRRMSNPLASLVGKTGDAISWLLRREVELNSASIAQGQMFNWYSSEKAFRELGYQVGDMDLALQDAWKWFKLKGYVK